MKERPILFSTPMVQAILAGNKKQTRLVVKSKSKLLPPAEVVNFHQVGKWFHFENTAETATTYFEDGKPELKTWTFTCPYGEPGDRLWVRETWRKVDPSECGCSDLCPHASGGYAYLASSDDNEAKWKPSIHMPRVVSRILLEITKVRVERLNDISGDDAKAEGFKGNIWNSPTARKCEKDYWAINWFRALWETINGQLSWHKNPWVWVVEFKVIEGQQS